MTLTLPEARQLAAQYQSPGSVGRTLAAFASGVPVSYERFLADIEMTSTEIGFDCHDDMRELKTWAEDTEDGALVWTDDDGS